MDDTWKVFDGMTDNMEDFIKKMVPELYLRPEVHPDVTEHFRIIRKLLEQSFYEYQFCDVAALQTMMTMEMALKLRYEEINQKKWNKNLKGLIKWFEDLDYFEVYNTFYLDSLRVIRNTLAHPSEHRFSGASAIHLIENVTDLINGLYEDPVLRKQRMDITRQMITKLEGFKKGIKCTMHGDKAYLAYCAWPGFVNNKLSPAEINFYFNPIFIIPASYLKDNNWVDPPVIHFRAICLEFKEDEILLKDMNDEQLIISEIKDDPEQNDLEEWRVRFEQYCYSVGSDPFSLHLREFHKQ